MTLIKAKKEWGRRRRQCAVGYIASGNVLFFSRYKLKPQGNPTCDPMTLREARALLEAMPSPGAAIFKLVPIEVGR